MCQVGIFWQFGTSWGVEGCIGLRGIPVHAHHDGNTFYSNAFTAKLLFGNRLVVPPNPKKAEGTWSTAIGEVINGVIYFRVVVSWRCTKDGVCLGEGCA